jgi:NAD-dependent deacetylase
VSARPPVGVRALAALMQRGGRIVALTGAGVSVPSGIPDFRSPGSGLWEGVDPMEVAHVDAFRRDPARFWSFYGPRFHLLAGKEPNRAHRVLAELERTGRLQAVITQNIDGLHQAAGSRDVVEVHGTAATASCPVCGARYPQAVVVERFDRAGDHVPRCDDGHPLKPDVVLFGDMLPEAEVRRAWELAASADLLLCVGSSLEVHPVAQLPAVALQGGARLAIVTRGSTPYDARADVRLGGDVAEDLQALLTELSREA